MVLHLAKGAFFLLLLLMLRALHVHLLQQRAKSRSWS